MQIISGVVEVASDVALRPANAVDYEMSAHTRELIDAGRAANTKRAYAQQAAWFEKWCAETGRSSFPVTTETFTEYVAHLVDLDASPSTIKQAMSAIRIAHRDLDIPGPGTQKANDVLRAHRRQRADRGQRVTKATPVVVDALRALIDATHPTSAAGLRDRVIVTLGFALFGRRSELSALHFADLHETPDGLVVHVARSKTDQDAEGAEVTIPKAKDKHLCPVRTTCRWRAVLAEADITAGPVLRRVDRYGNIGPSLTADSVNRRIRALAVRAELPAAETYTAHSLRAGGATAAYKAGAPLSAITSHGRWAEGSSTVAGYVRAVDRWKDNPLKGVL